MVDFGRNVFEDFVNGNIVFVGTMDAATDIADTFMAYDHVRCPLAFRPHNFQHELFFIGHGFAFRNWDRSSTVSSYELREKIVIPWDVITRVVNNLSNMDVDEIIDEVLDGRAYINVNPLEDDISDAVDVVCNAISQKEISSGCDIGGDEYTPYSYVQSLYDDNFRSLYVDYTLGEAELNATNALGLGAYNSTITPSVVYPIAYIAKKLSDTQKKQLYTEEDFSEIFN